jgi:hypothetical protein
MDRRIAESAFQSAASRRSPVVWWWLLLAVPFWATVWYANHPRWACHQNPRRPVVHERHHDGVHRPWRHWPRTVEWARGYHYGQMYRLGDFPVRPHRVMPLADVPASMMITLGPHRVLSPPGE